MIIDYSKLNQDQLNEMTELLFTKVTSKEGLKNWILFFLDLEIPDEITDSISNSNPLDAIWQVYENFYNNKGGEESPSGYIIVSARECLKTISASILEVILLIHFQFDIAHSSATEEQSKVATQQIESFLRKIEPLMKHRGWVQTTQNKRTLSYSTPENKNPYIKVLICSTKGLNSLHSNVLFQDEMDLADPIALREGRNITGYSKGIYGLQIFLSTRKFAGGNVADIIERKEDLNYKLLLWNILDVTEYCPPSRHKPDKPKHTRYVAKSLPLKQITQEQFDFLTPPEQAKFDKIENVYEGCTKCLLLAACRKKLSEKASTCVGNFYKPIVSVIQKFRENDPSTAESQLLCWKVGNTGLVYPRFNSAVDQDDSNVISLKKAYHILTGNLNDSVTEDVLLGEIKKQNIRIDASLDFGFTHSSVIHITALVNDEAWVLDTFSSPGLEFSDLLEIAMKFRDKYEPRFWWADQAMPSFIVTFNKNNMKCPKFTKDVINGVASLRAKIVDGTGRRRFKVIDTENNKKTIIAIPRHKFIIDSMGTVTEKPDDEDVIADLNDSLRYLAQNAFPVKGAGKIRHAVSEPKTTVEQIAQTTNSSFVKAVHEATGVTVGPKTITTKKKGGFYFSW